MVNEKNALAEYRNKLSYLVDNMQDKNGIVEAIGDQVYYELAGAIEDAIHFNNLKDSFLSDFMNASATALRGLSGEMLISTSQYLLDMMDQILVHHPEYYSVNKSKL